MRDPFRLLFVGWWMAGQSWMVTGQYLKPSVSVSPELVTLGENVTVHCHNAEHPGAEFSLYKGNLSLTRLLSQKAKDYEAEFIISITSISDAGTYQCDYCFKSSSQDLCSYYSDKVRISIVDPSISKPSIKMKPRNQNALQSSITIECHCHGDGLYFFLQKANTRGILQVLSGGPTGTANFHLQGKIKDAGRYICQYQHATAPFVWSEPSDPVELIVKGGWMAGQSWMSRGQDFPKPSISVSPSDMVSLRGNVNIHCWSEKVAQAEFALFRDGRVILLREAKLHEAVFSLASVKKTDSGIYWCKYQIRNDPDYRWSPDSDFVHINVIDLSLTKPFIKVNPRGKLAPGSDITIECQSKENGLTFSLRKSGKEIASEKTEPGGNTTKFLLSMRRTEDAGSYICQYRHRENPFVWSEPSDPVELVVTVISSREIVARLVAAGFVLLALVLIVAEAAYSWRKGEL